MPNKISVISQIPLYSKLSSLIPLTSILKSIRQLSAFNSELSYITFPWFDMFADNTYADACLTRITDKHHTYRLEMNGINMRETE